VLRELVACDGRVGGDWKAINLCYSDANDDRCAGTRLMALQRPGVAMPVVWFVWLPDEDSAARASSSSLTADKPLRPFDNCQWLYGSQWHNQTDCVAMLVFNALATETAIILVAGQHQSMAPTWS